MFKNKTFRGKWIQTFFVAQLHSLLANVSGIVMATVSSRPYCNIASEASYVYNLSGYYYAKNCPFVEFLKTWSFWSISVTRQVNFSWTKIDGNAKIVKLNCDIWVILGLKMGRVLVNETFLSDFQTLCSIWTIYPDSKSWV